KSFLSGVNVALPHSSFASSLLRRLASLEGGCCLQRLLRCIHDDAAAVIPLLDLQCRELHRHLLVADAEQAVDIDDGGGHLAVWPDQKLFNGADLLSGAVVDVLIGVVVSGVAY